MARPRSQVGARCVLGDDVVLGDEHHLLHRFVAPNVADPKVADPRRSHQAAPVSTSFVDATENRTSKVPSWSRRRSVTHDCRRLVSVTPSKPKLTTSPTLSSQLPGASTLRFCPSVTTLRVSSLWSTSSIGAQDYYIARNRRYNARRNQ